MSDYSDLVRVVNQTLDEVYRKTPREYRVSDEACGRDFMTDLKVYPAKVTAALRRSVRQAEALAKVFLRMHGARISGKRRPHGRPISCSISVPMELISSMEEDRTRIWLQVYAIKVRNSFD